MQGTCGIILEVSCIIFVDRRETIMHKKALLALLLVMAMMLSSCALIEKDLTVDRATEIIRVGDTVYTKGEIQDEVDYQLSYMAYYYSMFGMSYDTTDAQNIADTQQSVIDSLVESAVSSAKIAELGLDQLTEEEQAELDAAVEETWNYYYENVSDSYFAETELTGDELDAAITAKMEELGVTRDAVIEYEKSDITADKLHDYVVADVVVTDEELQAAYDEKVESDKTYYENYPATYGTRVNNGTTVYYRPAGYRMVKQILVKFNEDDQTLIDSIDSNLTDLNSQATSYTTQLTDLGVTDVDALLAQVTVNVEAADTITDQAVVTDVVANFDAETSEEVAEAAKALAEVNAQIAFLNEQLTAAKTQGYANIADKADDVLAQLADGADWDALMAEKTEDPGMQDGDTAKNGYAVCASTSNMDTAFLNAAMALANVGDVSDKTEGIYGYYIIQYTSDVEEGAVALEDVQETLTASKLSEKQETVYDETIAQWVSEADAKIDYNALNK